MFYTWLFMYDSLLLLLLCDTNRILALCTSFAFGDTFIYLSTFCNILLIQCLPFDKFNIFNFYTAILVFVYDIICMNRAKVGHQCHLVVAAGAFNFFLKFAFFECGISKLLGLRHLLFL